jgi:hypothetical protein
MAHSDAPATTTSCPASNRVLPPMSSVYPPRGLPQTQATTPLLVTHSGTFHAAPSPAPLTLPPPAQARPADPRIFPEVKEAPVAGRPSKAP